MRKIVWRSDIAPSAWIAETALIDRTWPKGIHIGAGAVIALGALAIEVATVSQAAIDEARAEIDEIAAGLGDAQDAAAAAGREVIRARAELDALDVDIAAQSALVSEHDMRITKLRGAADAALAAVALLALMRWRAPPWLVVLGCALAGAAMALV